MDCASGSMRMTETSGVRDLGTRWSPSFASNPMRNPSPRENQHDVHETIPVGDPPPGRRGRPRRHGLGSRPRPAVEPPASGTASTSPAAVRPRRLLRACLGRRHESSDDLLEPALHRCDAEELDPVLRAGAPDRDAAGRAADTFPHDHVVRSVPAQNHGDYSIQLQGFFVLCSGQGITSGACAPSWTSVGGPIRSRSRRPSTATPLTSTDAIEAAADAGDSRADQPRPRRRDRRQHQRPLTARARPAATLRDPTPSPERNHHAHDRTCATTAQPPGFDPTRKTALVAGVLYLVTFLASIPAVFLMGPVLTDPNYILGAGADARSSSAPSSTSSRPSPASGPRSRCSRSSSGSTKASRSASSPARGFEAAVIAIGVVSVLAVVTLQPAGRDRRRGDLPGHHAARARRRQGLDIHDGPGMAGLNALLLGTLMYRSRLVPRIIPTLGLIGAPLYLLGPDRDHVRLQRDDDRVVRRRRSLRSSSGSCRWACG